jgi:hypothetical protein
LFGSENRAKLPRHDEDGDLNSHQLFCRIEN